MSEDEDVQRQGAIADADAASADATNADAAKEHERLDALRRSIEQAELELKLANVRLERAKIEAEAERAARPWWRNWNIAAITAILAATAPVTAGVVGYFERQKQLALAEQQQKQESVRNSERQLEDIRNRYLDRVRNPGERRRTLRFLIVASNDPKLQEWARNEAPIVDAEAKRIDDEVASKERIAAESEAAYLAALTNARDPAAVRAHLQKIAVTARQAADNALDQTTKNPGPNPANAPSAPSTPSTTPDPSTTAPTSPPPSTGSAAVDAPALDALKRQADADRARANAAGGGGVSPKFPISAGLVPGL